MDWRFKVELFEQIRREYEFGSGTIQGVARKLSVHRRMVRKAVRNAIPARRKKSERRVAAQPECQPVASADIVAGKYAGSA